jgi:UDP-4-amino-4-deoxy-L-arabinose-oxoglutarate aminotransferase
VGHLGDAAVFSFYATKTMTCGDGGAVAVRDTAIADRLRRLRHHGTTKSAAERHGGTYQHWDMVELGFKAAMTDIEAALLLPQIDRLNRRRDRRQAIVERYYRALGGRPDIDLLSYSGRSGHHLITALVPASLRDRCLVRMSERGIGVAVNYRAVHTLTYYRDRFGFRREAYPVAAEIGDRTLSLPLWPAMTDAEVDRSASALCETLNEVAR